MGKNKTKGLLRHNDKGVAGNDISIKTLAIVITIKVAMTIAKIESRTGFRNPIMM